MSEKFQNKYRIPSARLQNWDYGWNAKYFVTICTKNREHFFGEIRDGEMQLSEIGKLVKLEWLKTLKIRPDMHLELGPFVVMPNHVHTIITIGENNYNIANSGRDSMHRVSTIEPDNNSLEYKINLHHNPKIWPPLFEVLNRQ